VFARSIPLKSIGISYENSITDANRASRRNTRVIPTQPVVQESDGFAHRAIRARIARVIESVAAELDAGRGNDDFVDRHRSAGGFDNDSGGKLGLGDACFVVDENVLAGDSLGQALSEALAHNLVMPGESNRNAVIAAITAAVVGTVMNVDDWRLGSARLNSIGGEAKLIDGDNVHWLIALERSIEHLEVIALILQAHDVTEKAHEQTPFTLPGSGTIWYSVPRTAP